MSQKFKIEAGRQVQLNIDGQEVTAGFNVVNGVPQLAYFPGTTKLVDVSTEIELGEEQYRVVSSGQSPFVPRMRLIILEKLNG